MADEIYFVPRQASAYLKISTSTLAKWRIYDGKLPFVKIGNRAVRYRKSDLDEFMTANLRQSTFDGDKP